MLLHTFLAQIEPASFLERYRSLGLYEEKDGIYEFPPLGRYRLFAGGFLAEDVVYAEEKALSVLDLRAYLYNRKGVSLPESYVKAVKELARTFSDLLTVNVTDGNNAHNLAMEALYRHLIQKKVLVTALPTNEAPNMLRVQVEYMLASSPSRNVAGYLDGMRMASLISAIDKMGIEHDLMPKSCIIVPYFSSAYQVSCLEVFYGKDKKSTLWLDEARFAFSCLLLSEGDSFTCLESTLSNAIEDIAAGQMEGGTFCTYRVNPDGRTIDWLPSRILYRNTEDIDGLTHAVPLIQEGVHCLLIADADSLVLKREGRAAYRSWAEAVADAVVRLIRQDKDLTPRIKYLLNTVRGEQVVKLSLQKRLKGEELYEVQQQLEAIFRSGIVSDTPQGCLYESPGGYMWESNYARSDASGLITNFVLVPGSVVKYEKGERYFQGELLVEGKSLEVTIPDSSFDTTRKLAESLRYAVDFSGVGDLPEPVIMDHVKAQPLLAYFQRAKTKLPISYGTSFLGWNEYRTEYVTPGMRCTKDGCRRVTSTPRPVCPYFRYLHAPGEDLEAEMPRNGLPRGLEDVLYRFVAILARSYHGHATGPYRLKNEAGNKRILRRLFSYLGQGEIVPLSHNARTEKSLDLFDGYPLLATGYNFSQAAACKRPLFLIGVGDRAIGDVTEEEIETAGKAILWAVEKLPVLLMKENGIDVPMLEEESDEEVLAEGKLLWDKICSL